MKDNSTINSPNSNVTLSPFHSGEQALQDRAGKREKMEIIGRKVVRSFIPEQHREFYKKLPFIVVGSVDNNGWPWSSIVSGKPGFIESPNATTLQFNVGAIDGDPLANTILNDNIPLGLLGIEPHTRRRNRVNGRTGNALNNEIIFNVDQSFGNCPQYIQHRSIEFIREPTEISKQHSVEKFTTFDESALALINNADTFFVSSFIQTQHRPDIEGVDVSHRGGRPGFIKIEGNTLIIPDYPGNHLYNTLGNFLINPKAGLVFVDFTTGEVLTLTGTVEILWDTNEDIQAFKGAERAWKFTLSHGIRLTDALPFRATLGEYSPNTMLTGNWQEAEAIKLAKKKFNEWQSFTVTHIKDESEDIRSFHLKPTNNDVLIPFKAGQYLTIKVPSKNNKSIIRTYTLSSSPNDAFYKISVKKEINGEASQYLHNSLQQGSIIEVKAPRGEFTINTTESRPAVLIAGGVGITPMISMANHIYNEGIRTRYLRPLTIIYATKTSKNRAFHNDFKLLEKLSQHKIRYFNYISQPTIHEKPGVDFNGSGRINADTYKQILALDDYDVYLCGSIGFMQAQYDTLCTLGVNDSRIYTEAFGTSSIQRITPTQPKPLVVQSTSEATTSIIKFKQSGFEQPWSAGDKTILETAEDHGLTPEFSCRTGNCGACSTKLLSGNITYRGKPTADFDKNNILICCAVPEKNSEVIELDL